MKTSSKLRVGEKRKRNGDGKRLLGSKCGGENIEDLRIYDESNRELHICTERERRKKMRNLFSNLHALLPDLPSKVDKSTIVDGAVSYIKALEQTLQNLQKQKLRQSPTATATLESKVAFMADDQGKNSSSGNATATAAVVPRLPVCFQTWISPNVVLNAAGEEAFISICCVKKAGFLSSMLFLLDKYKVEVVSAHFSSDNYSRSMCMMHARVRRESDHFPETLMIEETYKSVVGEMIAWLYS
ncbi:Transcription factor bHLH95 [Dendrobium catenatum]|uniref:Transcription factor bHLH95 n=1 Tax=Dendrobium catenatum TaxID=906689 RepID=A0A2I0WUB3_9ASPA|nr:Transcription factor bHLH95 [Dendrobium catenatum]